jgi:hypothetical protein
VLDALDGSNMDPHVADDLNLLQTSQTIFHAAVAANGVSGVSEDLDMSSTDLLGLDTMNLLQTSPVYISGVHDKLAHSLVRNATYSPSLMDDKVSAANAKLNTAASLFKQPRKSSKAVVASLAPQAMLSAGTPLVMSSTRWRFLEFERFVLFASVVVMAFIVALVYLMSKWLWKAFRKLLRTPEQQAIRDFVDTVAVTNGPEVVNQLAAAKVYECAITRPLSSKQLLRLEARVEEAISGFCLWSPLTQRACVHFVATVSRHFGKRQVPLAYQTSGTDFIVSLLDAPHVRVEIQSQDVSTFDMLIGHCNHKRTRGSASQEWKGFLESNPVQTKTWKPSTKLAPQSELVFQETAILLGAKVTVLGELHRNSVGTLVLCPWSESSNESSLEASTEQCKETQDALAQTQKPWLGKVWISDDPSLLEIGVEG